MNQNEVNLLRYTGQFTFVNSQFDGIILHNVIKETDICMAFLIYISICSTNLRDESAMSGIKCSISGACARDP
jgi:hypothetical protein